MGSLLIILSIIISALPAQAFFCTEVFEARAFRGGAVKDAKDFAHMNTPQRINYIDQRTADLTQQLQPTPRLWKRLFFESELLIHEKNRKLTEELRALSKSRKKYYFMLPMMEALARRGFFFEADEIQLLNRVTQSDKLFEAIEFLNQRFKDIPNKSITEKHFLDAVISYLTWGPDFSRDQTPIHHWVMFEILSTRGQPKLLEDMTRILFLSADMYSREKQQPKWEQLTPAQAKVEELWIVQQDPAYKMIQQTSPESIENVIIHAIDQGLLDYDKRVHSFRIKK